MVYNDVILIVYRYSIISRLTLDRRDGRRLRVHGLHVLPVAVSDSATIFNGRLFCHANTVLL
jgi:hypothetical protein